jgi:hypothetical protein
MMYGLSCATLMSDLLRLNLYVEIPITDSIRFFLRNLEIP